MSEFVNQTEENAKTPIRCFQKPNEQVKPVQRDVFSKYQYDVETSGMEHSTTFNAAKYFSALQGNASGTPLLHAEEVNSTQTLMGGENTALPIGSIFVADVQKSGKGRGKNVWTSPAGCLMFSFKSSFNSGENLPFVQYLVSLAIVRAIKSFPVTEGIDVGIKWPNDIYVNRNIKIGGMISQSSYYEGTFHIVTGIGINLDNAEPTTCINQLLKPGDPTITREELLARVMNEYMVVERNFIQQGFEQFHTEYLQTWLHSEQQVQVDVNRTHQAMQQQQQSSVEVPATVDMRLMTIKGLTKTGGLSAIEAGTHRPYELYPDGNTFDFFQGLITRKL